MQFFGNHQSTNSEAHSREVADLMHVRCGLPLRSDPSFKNNSFSSGHFHSYPVMLLNVSMNLVRFHHVFLLSTGMGHCWLVYLLFCFALFFLSPILSAFRVFCACFC